MAYTIPEFITHATAGDAIKVKTNGSTNMSPAVGGVLLKLSETVYYDLGKYHTAKQVLDSYDLRVGIDSGVIEAVAGTVALSREPVV